VLALLACSTGPGEAQTTRARTGPAQTLETLFGEEAKDVAASGRTDDDVILARKMLAAARKLESQPALTLELLEKARVLAGKAPAGYGTAIWALELLADRDAGNRDKYLQDIASLRQRRHALSRGIEKEEELGLMVETLMELSDSKGDAGNHAAAMTCCRKAYALARGAKSPMADELAAKLKVLVQTERLAGKIARAEARLKTDQTDAARDELIRMYLIDMDNPAAAARLVNEDSDEFTRIYAPLATKDPAELEEGPCMELAAWYRTLADKATGALSKAGMLRRAKGYYEAFLAGHPKRDLAYVKAAMAMEEVNQRLKKLKPPAGTGNSRATKKPTFPAGAPVGPGALVRRPAPIDGVLSWTIETRLHRGGLNAVGYSGEGRYLATGGSSGVIRLWDAATGGLIRVLVSPARGVGSLVWSPGGTLLAAGSRDGYVHIWSAGSGRILRTLKTGSRAPVSMVWSLDSAKLAVGGGRSIHVWDTAAGKVAGKTSLTGKTDGADKIAATPDGRTLAAACGYKVQTICIVGASSGKTLRRIKPKHGEAADIAFSPTPSPRLAVALHKGYSKIQAIEIYDPRAARLVRSLKYTDGEGSSLVAWSPDATKLAGVSRRYYPKDVKLRIWDVGSGKLLAGLPAHSDRITSLAWSPDGQFLATVGRDFAARIIDVAGGKVARTIGGLRSWLYGSPAWSPDGRVMAWPGRAANGGIVWLWDVAAGKPLPPRKVPAGTRGLRWSPDGKKLLGLAGYKTLVFLDMKSRKKPETLPTREYQTYTFAWSPDSTHVAYAGRPRREGGAAIYIVDPETALGVKTISTKHRGVGHLAFSPDGKVLAAASGYQIDLWNIAAGERLAGFNIGKTRGRIRNLAWSPDGKAIATGGTDNCVRLWSVETGKQTAQFTRKYMGDVRDVAWSPDGKKVASACEDYKLRVWDVASGETSPAIPISAYSVAWLNGGRTIAAGSNSHVRLFDAETGERTMTFLPLAGAGMLVVNARGQYTGTGKVDEQIVYVAVMPSGRRRTFTPARFARKFGWRNNPAAFSSRPRLVEQGADRKGNGG